MGTRSAVGFIIDGQEKITYSHFDGYPSGVGMNVLNFCRNAADWDAIKDAAKDIVLVSDSEVPDDEQVKALEPHAEVLGTEKFMEEWYGVLRNLHGNLDGYLKVGFMTDDHMFPMNSLFCEYAYIVNLDEGKLEAYKGFQREPHTKGRFADPNRDGQVLSSPGDRVYYSVALVNAWYLDALPTDARFEAAFDTDEDEDED